jgi:hypothetical protein
VGVDGCGAINHLTSLIVVIERLPHEVDIVTEGQSMALFEHEVVQQGHGAVKGPGVEPFTRNIPRGSGAVGTR